MKKSNLDLGIFLNLLYMRNFYFIFALNVEKTIDARYIILSNHPLFVLSFLVKPVKILNLNFSEKWPNDNLPE